jgi:hypothetical protein
MTNDNATVDFRRVRFERELRSITNGADFEDLGEEQLRQLIKLLFARQREIGRGDEDLQEMLRDFRNASDEAMSIFDQYDETLN